MNALINKLQLIESIETDIRIGILSMSNIARKHNVPLAVVHVIWNKMCETENG